MNEDSMGKPLVPGWAKTLFALCISGIILFISYKDEDWSKIYEATINANYFLAIGSLVASQLCFWIFNVITIHRTYAWFHKPISFKDYFWVRGAAYLLTIITGVLGGGGIALYLKRKTQVTWFRLLGIGVFRVALHVGGLCLLFIPCTIALHYLDLFEKVPLNPYVWWAVLITAALLFLDGWMTFLHKKPMLFFRFIMREQDKDFWYPFRVATRWQWALTLSWGVIPYITSIICLWFYAQAFGVEVPFLVFFTTCLLVLMISEMPFAFAGFGITTVAWGLFYKDYGSPEALASLTLILPICRLLIRAAIGVVSFRPAIDDLNTLIGKPQVDGLVSDEDPKVSSI